MAEKPQAAALAESPRCNPELKKGLDRIAKEREDVLRGVERILGWNPEKADEEKRSITAPEMLSRLERAVTLMMQIGIVPVIMPSRKPFLPAERVGHILSIMDDKPVPSTVTLSDGEWVELVITPFPLGEFIKPTDLLIIRDLAKCDKLGFQFDERQASHHCIAQCDRPKVEPGKAQESTWSESFTLPASEISIHLNAQVLHYGSGLFEGIGVERGKDGVPRIFRLKDHWERMNAGAKLCGMPEIPWELFEKMAIDAVKANAEYIPPAGQGRLYLRVNYVDIGPHLHVGHSPKYYLAVTAFPIGTSKAYFTSGKFAVALDAARAVEYGIGQAKVIGNYSGVMKTVDKAKEHLKATGVIFTDPGGKGVLRESQASGILFVRHARKKGEKHTIIFPKNRGDILGSITMKTIREIAERLGYAVREEDVTMANAGQFDEAFAVGTAAGIAPIDELIPVNFHTEDGIPEVVELKRRRKKVTFYSQERLVSTRLAQELCAIKKGDVPDHTDMLTRVDCGSGN